MTILLNCGLFLIFNLLMASHHADLIRDNKPIRHGLWATVYLLPCILAGYLFSWWYLPMLLCLRAYSFSIFLNLYREKKWDYWSLTSTSILDKLERKIFRKFWIARLFYFVGWLIFITIELYIQ